MPKVKRLMRMTTALRSFRLSRAVVPQTLAAQNHSLLKLPLPITQFETSVPHSISRNAVEAETPVEDVANGAALL
ncbi:hypothetical protein BKA70DRAFT_1331242, partial [Coprinopsis sp. MPI-PUGE-AT-0042]